MRALAVACRLALLASLAATASCGGNGTGPAGLPNVTTANLSQFQLQFAVGTATIGAEGGGFYTGLNTVSTFRQPPHGLSATTSNTPTITAPAGMNLFNGTNVIAGITIGQIAATPAPTFAQAAALYGLGPLVGAFGYGLAPANLLPQAATAAIYAGQNCQGPISGLAGSQAFGNQIGYSAIRYNAMQLPVGGDPTIGCPPLFPAPVMPTKELTYYGTPPAWPSPIGYGIAAGFLGYPLGFTDFAVAPVAGTYTMNVTFPSNDTGTSYANYTATANLPAGAIANPLPNFAPPVLAIQNDGSAIVTLTVPAGVTEAIVFINTNSCTNPPQANNNFSVLTRQTGFQTLLISNALGPPDANGNPTHTFCTLSDFAALIAAGGTAADTYTINAVGFDYPAYEASYPQSTSLTPAITNGDGHSGTADITVSAPVNGTFTPS